MLSVSHPKNHKIKIFKLVTTERDKIFLKNIYDVSYHSDSYMKISDRVTALIIEKSECEKNPYEI